MSGDGSSGYCYFTGSCLVPAADPGAIFASCSGNITAGNMDDAAWQSVGVRRMTAADARTAVVRCPSRDNRTA
ncbi:hypothetical protein SDC9_91971 [bioreactor metagenome]|uniref:Uncharacterized protein n=1 Tax=bioreactor metagenome TaxID=1076179 RepID=A0A644ZWH3_9ZZZZ